MMEHHLFNWNELIIFSHLLLGYYNKKSSSPDKISIINIVLIFTKFFNKECINCK